LQRADELWGDVEEVVKRRQGWAKMATIMRVVGDMESSDDYARKYIDSVREETSRVSVPQAEDAGSV
jgi:hypothetical protein